MAEPKPTSFAQAATPILFLLVLIGYGLIARPHLFDQPALPLEVVFVLAATFSTGFLLSLGFGWAQIQERIVRRLARALPAFFILLFIGLVIGSWMVSGTIPMLVYLGLKLIDPRFLYLLAFAVPAIFSTLTGTSWGSAGSVGVVMIGIATAQQAHLGITAGAIIGGAYFGDKLSPLSDTTNMAAIACEVELFDHIRSMLYTTVPSTLIAAAGFLVLGFTHPPGWVAGGIESVTPVLAGLASLFRFNPLLLLPPLVVLYGSLRRYPSIPTLAVSMLCACGLALLFQPYTSADVAQSLYKGFDAAMAAGVGPLPEQVAILVNRGGLYALIDAIVVAFTVFFFVGSLDVIDALPRVVGRVFGGARRPANTVLASLAAAGVTNAMTSNQYATSFIVGDTFKSRYDALGLSRRILSRSIEDTGTMLESVVPWTPTAVFMVATLGVSFSDYWHWQLLSLANLVVAPLWAVLGIGWFGGPRPPASKAVEASTSNRRDGSPSTITRSSTRRRTHRGQAAIPA